MQVICHEIAQHGAESSKIGFLTTHTEGVAMKKEITMGLWPHLFTLHHLCHVHQKFSIDPIGVFT